MKFRASVPLSVPGTTAQDVHDVPSNFVNRIALAVPLPLMTNRQTVVPSVAPYSPPPDLNACPPPKFGGFVILAQLLRAAL